MLYEEEEGQMSYFPVSDRVENLIVQSNNLIKAQQNLTLNEAKLIRIIIMQIVANDVDFKAYEISPSELARLIGNEDGSNIYRRAQDFTDKLQSKKLKIKQSNGSWQSIVWVPTCQYDSKRKKIKIKLNDDLKPYLLNLVETGYYTQYALDTALSFRSVYALRIHELLMMQIRSRLLPKEGIEVDLYIDDIRDACMLYKQDSKGNYTNEDKYVRVSQLKEKVINIACKEINDATMFNVYYKDIKQGRSIIGFRFHIGRASIEDSNMMNRRVVQRAKSIFDKINI